MTKVSLRKMRKMKNEKLTSSKVSEAHPPEPQNDSGVVASAGDPIFPAVLTLGKNASQTEFTQTLNYLRPALKIEKNILRKFY